MLRNIGIFAHVDAGKTTLTEQMLLVSGAIREAGSVDRGTAHTDQLPVEKRRGISVKATCAAMRWGETEIRCIDTPGHVDFSAEIERSLWALDGAVLVVSAPDGLDPQTELLFRVLEREKIPTLLFLNKCDRPDTDPEAVIGQIRRRLSSSVIPLFEGEEQLVEAVCAEDESLMERFLAEEPVSVQEARCALARLTAGARVYPVLKGSALRGEGVRELMEAVSDFLPGPDREEKELCGIVFAAQQDRLLGRGVWVRLFGGELRSRDPVRLPGRPDPQTGEEQWTEKKITQIRGADGQDAGVLRTGEIGVIFGLGPVPVGQTLGDEKKLPRSVRPGEIRSPLMTVQALPDKPENMEALRQACMELSLDDPLLQARFSRVTGELQLQIMGKIQLEILEDTLLSRYGLSVSFAAPTVIYRETIAHAGVGFAAYTMPKPCWAVLRFDMEPGPRGSGITYESVVPVREIMARYQHQVEQALPLALRQGRLGWQVTDVKITLSGGGHHLVHTHPMDFILATPWAIHDGLRNCGSVLLEPILEIHFLLPQDCLGRIISDIHSMRGEVLSSEAGEDLVSLTALVPAAESLDYSVRLASATGGRGSMAIRLHSWRECPLELGHTAKLRNVDPLDTSRYILAARNAMAGGVFEME